MKKLFSLTLALLLILSMTATAFADDEVIEEPGQGGQPTEWNGTYTASDTTTFTIKKTYTSDNNVVVNEKLTFTSTAATTNPDDGTANLTIPELTVDGLTEDITVTVPSYSTAGIYDYTIKETAGSTAGVTYTSAEIKVQVLVEYDNDAHKLVIGNPKDATSGITYYIVKTGQGESATKVDTFTNTFNSGSFSVAKDVIGNMASESETFGITVTLTSSKKVGTKIKVGGVEVDPVGTEEKPTWTYDETKKVYTYTTTLNISEKDGATTFSDIPAGVTVTVAENDVGTDNKVNGYDYKGIYTGTYTVSGTDVTGTQFTSPLTITGSTNDKITVVNSKSAAVATGISLDTVPYFLMLAVACVGMFLVLSKKRAYREN